MIANRKFQMLAFCILALQGCAIQRAQQADDAKVKLVGMGEEQILACMGIPAAKAAVGNTEVWSYNSGNGRVDAFAAGHSSTNAYGTPTSATANTDSFAAGFAEKRFCTVNLVMSAGRVSAVNYAGPTGGLLTKGEQCAFAVENCLK